MASPETKPGHRSSSGELASPSVTEVCADLKLTLPPSAEIDRYLGYPHGAIPGRNVAQRIRPVVEEAQLCLKPRGAFSLHAVTGRGPRSLTFGDAAIFGSVGEFLEGADRIAIFVVTVGEEISQLAAQARQRGDVFMEWVVDAVGSWAAEATADALMECIRHHTAPDESLTLRYSPGYCGMDIAQQRTLFEMVQADAIGVKLLPSCLMYPLKSLSGSVGLGPGVAVDSHRAPCDHCDRVGCHMRR